MIMCIKTINKKLILFFMSIVIIMVQTNRSLGEVGIKLGELSKEDIAENRKLEAIEDADITNVQLVDVGETFAILEWETNKESTVNIRFGERIPGDRNIIEMTKKFKHTVLLDRLEPANLYYFSIKGQEEYRGQFQTPGRPYPKLLSDNISVAKNRAEITMNFNKEIKGNLKWSNAKEPDNIYIIKNTSYNNTHKFILSDLVPSNVYYYEFEGADESGKKFAIER